MAVNLKISKNTILNTDKLRGRRIWLFTVCPDAFNPLSVVNWMLSKIQFKTWTQFPTSNMLTTSQTRRFNLRHLLCRGRKYTLVPALGWSITLPSHGNATLRVTLRGTYNTIPTTHLQHVKSTNLSSVGSRRNAWRRTMTMCWRRETLLCVSKASKTEMACRSWWVACQIIRLSGSGNYTLSRIWDGMTITNAQSNTGVEILSKACDGWCGSQLMPRISATALSIALTAIGHQNTSIPKCTLRTGGGRHR